MKKIIGYYLVVCGIMAIGLGEVFGEVTPTVTATPTIVPTPLVDCLCSVSGTVTDIVTGEGIKDAVVRESVFTGSDGSYTWDGPEFPCYNGGAHILTASAEGYIKQVKAICVEPCVKGELNFSLIPSSTPLFMVTSGGEIETSEFTYPKNGKGVITVTVTANEKRCEGILVTAIVGKGGKKYVSVINPYTLTGESGQAEFVIRAKDRSGKARIVFKAGNTKKSVIVEVK